jgi:hypothetical protein
MFFCVFRRRQNTRHKVVPDEKKNTMPESTSLRIKRHCTQNSFENNLCPTTSTHILILKMGIPASLKEKGVKHNEISNNVFLIDSYLFGNLLLFSSNA